MNINQLKYFIAASETQSFTKASKQYFISQTAITQQIKALEDSIGVVLFNRNKRPLSLTPAGETFLLEAKAIVERMETAIIKTKEASTGLVGNLTIGYTKGFERSDLSSHIRLFHLDYPNILIQPMRNAYDELSNKLIHNEYDIIYSMDGSNLKEDPIINSKIVYQSRFVVALYPTHPLARRSSITRADLKNENLLYLSPSSKSNSIDDGYYLSRYKQSGYDPKILFYSSDAESILMMVACEEGISILPDYCTNKLNNAENIVFVPLEGENEIMPIYALWKKDNTNPALKLYIDHI